MDEQTRKLLEECTSGCQMAINSMQQIKTYVKVRDLYRSFIFFAFLACPIMRKEDVNMGIDDLDSGTIRMIREDYRYKHLSIDELSDKWGLPEGTICDVVKDCKIVARRH